jgi:hypothetical protein
MKRGKGKRGQVTIFVIIAIVIVAAVLITFLFPRIKKTLVPGSPSIRLRECIEEDLNEAVELVSKQGGSINPANSYLFEGVEREYLCYTNQYYQTCSNQKPLLRQHVEREILDEIKPKVRGCLNNLKEDLRSEGYSVSGGEEISLSIVPNSISVVIEGLNINKEGTESYDEFEVSKRSQLYKLLMLSASILNWEARYGDSDITNYMLYYPDVKVEKLKQGDGSKVYKLNSGEDKFVFATRSLSWPAGYGFGEIHNPVRV